MHLTRFDINTARRDSRALLASPQKLHAAVLASFPPIADGTGRVLWRVDRAEHRAALFIVSPHRPDLTHLVEQAGWPATDATWDTRDYQPLLDRLDIGQQWAFRLTANPTASRRKAPDSPRSQRFGHVTVAQQTAWLLTRAERLGFTIPVGEHKEPDVAIRSRDNLAFARQGRTVTLTTATYEGHLRITDPDALRTALTEGIGPAKAYGCGLLTLAPIRHA
ncbi:type I-E CRISPR-associated protein Cas6/Cse3/CasE [Amycolatopsis panacis]|uniref:Type I-E CRISPR-associated protein Cas6/Cse3/CasE n=1 Tax=Amycolatopsis panacis TaxID=2340917 RepID=A0A419I972_9PSEU|nr:type I-E CRISPR-associated protein Cas6/Cse3/CasE [Amycolatopsis panacis]RJQ89102.1 type I-E CRISPR-associated protein Cas6/Cse3/CasE [Amycolatopsis panacis]